MSYKWLVPTTKTTYYQSARYYLPKLPTIYHLLAMFPSQELTMQGISFRILPYFCSVRHTPTKLPAQNTELSV